MLSLEYVAGKRLQEGFFFMISSSIGNNDLDARSWDTNQSEDLQPNSTKFTHFRYVTRSGKRRFRLVDESGALPGHSIRH